MQNKVEKMIYLATHKSANYVLAGFIFMCLFSYVYFANEAVRTVSSLERLKTEVQTLSIKVSEMESERLVIENGIGSELATAMGFVEIENQTFIVNKSNKTAFVFDVE